MTQAQKIAKEKFKKAIAYRKKTGATLKEAFAFVYGRKVSPVKKKAAPKKKAAVKKVSAPKKKVAPKKAASKNINVLNNKSIVSGVGNIVSKTMKDISDTKKIILDQSELLERLQESYKKSKIKINKELIMMDIKTLKYNFIPNNKRYLKTLQNTLKKSM